MHTLTALLNDIATAKENASEQFLNQIYQELRAISAALLAKEKSEYTLQPTALVHEAWIRLMHPTPNFENRRHFFVAASTSMRRILVEQARRRQSQKHGGQLQQQPLHESRIAAPCDDASLIGLDVALEKFARLHPEKACLLELRYFTGLTADQAAEMLQLSPSTADRHWTFARAWLRREMEQ